MNEILLGTIVFTSLIMALVLIIIGARAIIWGNKIIRITVNNDRIIEGILGEKLLSVLSQNDIHLPTSCGGAGTCALCQVNISGTNDDGDRLACQFVVREDFNITVDQGQLSAKTWVCPVLKTRTLAPLIKEIVLDISTFDRGVISAGNYILISAPAFKLSFSQIQIQSEYEPTWQRLGLRALKAQSTDPQTRAYSLVNRPDDKGVLILNIRLALAPGNAPDAPPGVVSSYLFGLTKGAEVEVTGPFGNFFVQDTDREMIFIGGGVGMAPLYAHVHDQLERLKTKRVIRYWYGARAQEDLYYAAEMETLAVRYENFSWHPVLSDPRPEDEWNGETGFIHEAVYRKYLSRHPAPENCEYYLCGPPLMIQAVRTMLDKLGVPTDNVISDDFGT
ncbi:MAG: NADH:ubiquinone reductase (Na(+)-transporting) subunit F [Rhodospirillaceae bacterium]|nr:MAG: NADH:ubiquinone reductase (Na(+)-transporting) subunit F [Rhodospirillaceae bacterium]